MRAFLRRSFRAAAMLFVSGLVLASMSACTRGREPEIKSPQAFTTASIGDAKRLLPMLASDSASGEITGIVFNGLVKYDKDLKLIPELAESWEISDDNLTITFHLRKGVKWHDGMEFTSEDVLFTYGVITNPNTPTPYSANYGPVSSVTAHDSYTVEVRYSRPFAPALESWGMGIVPRHVLEGVDISDDKYTRNPIGTGPYKLTEWVTGQKIVLTANQDYFEGRPGIEQYILRIIPDQAASFMELKTGGIDMQSPSPQQYKLNAETEFFKRYFQSFRYPSFAYTYMAYNHLDPRFADKRVRRALTHAINKQDIIEGVLLGYGTPCSGPFPSESWAYNADVQDLRYDPELAITLLREAGWEPGPDGIMQKGEMRLSFKVLTNQGNDQRLKAAQIIKEQLKAVGVEIEINVLEWQAFLHEFVDKKRFEAIILGWQLSRDPDAYDIWHSSKTKEGEFNFISYKDEELDALLIEGRGTFDMDARKRIYRRVHEIMVEDQPYTFLYVPDALPIVHKRFKGIEKAPLGIMYDFIKWTVPAEKARWYE